MVSVLKKQKVVLSARAIASTETYNWIISKTVLTKKVGRDSSRKRNKSFLATLITPKKIVPQKRLKKAIV